MLPLNQSFTDWNICWVPRCLNQTAYLQAKIALSLDDSCTVLHVTPNFILLTPGQILCPFLQIHFRFLRKKIK